MKELTFCCHQAGCCVMLMVNGQNVSMRTGCVFHGAVPVRAPIHSPAARPHSARSGRGHRLLSEAQLHIALRC